MMTTIAYDRELREVAADSQESWGSEKYNCRKLYRVGELIVATAGGSYAGMRFVRWLDSYDGEPVAEQWDDEAPDLIHLASDEDFECLVIRPDASCFTVNRLFVPLEQDGNRFITLGSGGAVAQGAMRAGASPGEAVRIACGVDSYTGGRVQVIQF